MEHITDCYQPARNGVIEPHQQPRNQEEQTADGDGPEIEFLAAIEEADVFRFNLVLISRVLFHAPNKLAVNACPGHGCEPVEELKKEEDLEHQTEPGMQRARSRPATKDKGEKMEKPWRIDGKASNQGKHETHPNRPMQ